MNIKKNDIVVLSDIHIPFEDDDALEAALGVIERHKPSVVVLLGDVLDFFAISSHEKDPARGETLQYEIDAGIMFFRRLRSIVPDARIPYVLGNHEDRLRRWIWKHKDVASLRALDFDALLETATYGIETIPYADDIVLGDVLFRHGKACGVTAGRKNLQAAAMSGASGHTHKLSRESITTRAGLHTWVQTGCLCDLEPDWVNGTANWQHGFAIGDMIDGQYFLRPVEIHKGVALV